MGFPSGTVSFNRFLVTGEGAPAAPDQSLLDKLAANVLRGGDDVGTPEEVEYGWCGGRHVYDAEFSFAHNVFADAVHFALRVDTNKVPGDVRRAYEMMEEEAVAKGNPSGFVSKAQKRDVRDAVEQKAQDEVRSGRHRKSRAVPVLWDLPSGTLYSPAGGANAEKLAELFERTFGLALVPLTSGRLAARTLEALGRRRDFEDLRPTQFVAGADGDASPPDYPWVAKGPEPKDFLGNEFLLWLCHEADAGTSMVRTETVGEVTVYFDRSLDLECAFGQTGRDALRGDGPTRTPEALDGFRTGKLPRRAGLVLDARRQQYALTLGAEAMSVGGGRLPEVEDADSARTLFEARIGLVRDLCAAIDGLFGAFLTLRAGGGWVGHVARVRRWILQERKGAA